MKNKNLLAWLLLGILACIWGSSFFLMKLAMYAPNGELIFTDNQLGSLRMAIGGLVMLPFGFYFRKKINSYKDFFSILIVGTCGNFFPAFLFAYAETELSSGIAGMLNGFTSFFTLIIGLFLFKQQLLKNQLIGLIIAFLGLIILVFLGKNTQSIGSFSHVGAIVLSTCMYGLSLNTIKHKLAHFKAIEITSLAFSLMFLPALLVSFFNHSFYTVTESPFAMQGISAIMALSIVGTCFALVLFNRIIKLKTAVFASTVTYFIPIIASLLGILFLKEKLFAMQIVGMLIIVTGVYWSNYSKR